MTNDKKRALVQRILKNDTYLPESELFQKLEQQLNDKLSGETLQQLDLIVDIIRSESNGN